MDALCHLPVTRKAIDTWCPVNAANRKTHYSSFQPAYLAMIVENGHPLRHRRVRRKLLAQRIITTSKLYVSAHRR